MPCMYHWISVYSTSDTILAGGGGVVNVYHSVELERMRRQTLIGFYVWAGEAAALIEDAYVAKQEYLEEEPDQELPDVIWESFPDEK